MFSNNRMHHNDWVIATWPKYFSRSVIIQKGSNADKANLPASMNLSNRPHPAGLKHRNGAAMAEQIGDVAEAGVQQQHRRHRRGPHDAINIQSDNSSDE